MLPPLLGQNFRLLRGDFQDYLALERFHYRAARPRTWDQIWIVRYQQRIVGVGVLSWPMPTVRGRVRHFGLRGCSYRLLCRLANRHFRTISRIIVHPQFRSLGIGAALVRTLCTHGSTRYIDSAAMMGRAHPLFERGGMQRIEPAGPDETVYYLFDRLQR